MNNLIIIMKFNNTFKVPLNIFSCQFAVVWEDKTGAIKLLKGFQSKTLKKRQISSDQIISKLFQNVVNAWRIANKSLYWESSECIDKGILSSSHVGVSLIKLSSNLWKNFDAKSSAENSLLGLYLFQWKSRNTNNTW